MRLTLDPVKKPFATPGEVIAAWLSALHHPLSSSQFPKVDKVAISM